MSDKEFLERIHAIVHVLAIASNQCSHKYFRKKPGECKSCDIELLLEETEYRIDELNEAEKQATKAQGGIKSLLEDLP